MEGIDAQQRSHVQLRGAGRYCPARGIYLRDVGATDTQCGFRKSLHDALSRLLNMQQREPFGLSLIAAQHGIQDAIVFVPYAVTTLRRFHHGNHRATQVMPIQT